MKIRLHLLFLVSALGMILIPTFCFAWGTWAHMNITSAAIQELPLSMYTVFASSSTFLINTTTDNGVRTGWDPNESNFHFINLGGANTGSCQWPFWDCMPQTVDAFVAKYGGATSALAFNAYIVDSISRGFLVPALITWHNNPTASNYTTVMVWMCREAHYMEDLSQPLHDNYIYNANGVHARYETDMLSTFTPTISVTPNAATYQSNILQYCFSRISASYPYGITIDAADTASQNGAGGSTSNNTYYTLLWASTQSFTTTFLDESAITVASIWYTAWVNAGLDTVPVSDWKSYSSDKSVNKQ